MASLIIVRCTFVYMFRVKLINKFTDIESIEKEALYTVPCLVLNIIPDLFNFIMKELINALEFSI